MWYAALQYLAESHQFDKVNPPEWPADRYRLLTHRGKKASEATTDPCVRGAVLPAISPWVSPAASAAAAACALSAAMRAESTRLICSAPMPAPGLIRGWRQPSHRRWRSTSGDAEGGVRNPTPSSWLIRRRPRFSRLTWWKPVTMP